MKFANTVFALGTGIAIGIALVLSCGDGSPRSADAADASCNCPAAESPIAGRIMEVTASYIIPANSMHQHQGVACPIPDPGIVLNGGCTADIPLNGSLVLEESAPGGIGWGCTWNNPSNVDVPVHLVVHCLKPQ